MWNLLTNTWPDIAQWGFGSRPFMFPPRHCLGEAERGARSARRHHRRPSVRPDRSPDGCGNDGNVLRRVSPSKGNSVGSYVAPGANGARVGVAMAVARADEVAHVQIGDLMLGRSPRRDGSSVLIHGKGDKQRRCPLWARTATMLAGLVNGREPGAHAFLNRCGEPLTRFGIYTLVERHAVGRFNCISWSIPGAPLRRLRRFVARTVAWHSPDRKPPPLPANLAG